MVATTQAPPRRVTDRGHGHGGTSSMTSRTLPLKRCSACRIEKPHSEFHKARNTNDGLHNQCKLCRRETNRKPAAREARRAARRRYQAKNPETRAASDAAYSERYPDRKRARRKLYWALQAGRMVRPAECEGCGRTDVGLHAHHADYAKPYDVSWLCFICHGEEHEDG